MNIITEKYFGMNIVSYMHAINNFHIYEDIYLLGSMKDNKLQIIFDDNIGAYRIECPETDRVIVSNVDYNYLWYSMIDSEYINLISSLFENPFIYLYYDNMANRAIVDYLIRNQDKISLNENGKLIIAPKNIDNYMNIERFAAIFDNVIYCKQISEGDNNNIIMNAVSTVNTINDILKI